MSKLKKALDKAKGARDNRETLLPANEQAMATVTPGPEIKVETSSRTIEPEPVIQQTRVVEIDLDWFKKNKALSFLLQNSTADNVKILRTQVLERLKKTGGNSILISSARPREGKTTIAVNLAFSIAQEISRTTLLVDADLRKPEVHRYFGLKVYQGLTEYLLGEAELSDLLINPGIDKLTILPGGRPLANSTELLGSPKMESLVQELKGRYSDRIVIFDTTSLLTQADPIVFSQYIDGIVLIIEAERTSSKDLERVLTLLKDKPVIGTLLNKTRK